MCGIVAAKTILLVDANKVVTEAFAAILRDQWFNVKTAGSAEAAYRVATTWHPDATILEIHLPKVSNGLPKVANGLECLTRLRMHDQTLPIAIVTGGYFLAPTLRQKMQKIGVPVMFKPLWRQDLVALARSLTATREPEPA